MLCRDAASRKSLRSECSSSSGDSIKSLAVLFLLFPKSNGFPPMLQGNGSRKAQKRSSPEPPSLAGCWLDDALWVPNWLHRDFVQTDILDRSPDHGQTTGLRREDIDLISALAHIAEQAFNGIGGLNVAVHRLRKSIKGQQVLFILRQAANGLGIALRVFGFESGHLGQGLRLCGLPPDADQFGLDIAVLSSGDG